MMTSLSKNKNHVCTAKRQHNRQWKYVRYYMTELTFYTLPNPSRPHPPSLYLSLASNQKYVILFVPPVHIHI